MAGNEKSENEQCSNTDKKRIKTGKQHTENIKPLEAFQR